LFQAFNGIPDIYGIVPDPEKIYELLRRVDIALDPVRHQYTDHPVRAQSFCTKGRYDRTVFASGDPDHSITFRPVFLEKLPDPQNTLIFYLFCIKHHMPVLAFRKKEKHL
jgi:hypothetical protein